jgi:hypothetical protein
MTASWRLKFQRAEKHFHDLQGALGLPIGRHEYPVAEELNAEGEYDYRLALPEHPLNEEIPLIAGDILFNIRSGLDHLFSALISGDDKARAQFPIFTDNPLEIDQTTGKYLRPWAKGAWLAQTTGVPLLILAGVVMLQSFYQARQVGIAAQHHSLAVLATLQNADKHEKLTFIGPVLNKTLVTVEGVVTYGIVPGLHNGAIIFTHPTQVNAKMTRNDAAMTRTPSKSASLPVSPGQVTYCT